MNAFHVHRSWHSKLNTIVTAAVFIIVGLLFLGRNLGYIDDYLFHMLVSWQMLLVVIGIVQLIKRNLIGGLILITIGIYFLLPTPWALRAYWPVLLIVIGVGILFKLGQRQHGHRSPERTREESITGEDGFVRSDVNFGGSKHIVLDPIFKGADLSVTFGSIALDLRRTKLESETTYIDVSATFGGIELYIPSDWNVIIEANATMGGIEDKRFVSHQINEFHKLVIRGGVTFSGVEIKS